MLILLIAAATLLFAFSLAAAEEKKTPSGTVKIHGGSFALGIGWSWGEGTLTYEGKEYKFKVSGMKVIDVGGSSFDAVGEVYKLKKLDDFPGTYVAGTAGAAVGGGVAASSMSNENGVMIDLRATKVGLQFTLAPGGMKIKWTE